MADSNEVYLVTGANRGIGLETCRQLKARGATVIAAVRAVSDGLTEVGVDKVPALLFSCCPVGSITFQFLCCAWRPAALSPGRNGRDVDNFFFFFFHLTM